MKNIFLVLLLSLFYSCSHSIKVKTNANRFLSSEAQGRIGKGNVETFIVQGTEATVDLRNQRTDNPLKLQRENSQAYDFAISGELGVWTPIDIFHVSGGRMGTDITGLKLQVYGDARKDAKKNNLSVSLFAGSGSVTNNVEEGNDLELVPADDDTTSEFEITNQTIGVLVGYRPADKVQVTLGYQISNHSFSGVLESENVSLDGEKVDYKGKSHLTTLTTTYNFTNWLYLSSELTSDVIKWQHTKEAHYGYFNLAIGFMW